MKNAPALPLILPLYDCRSEDAPLVGGKGANLGECIRARVNVPPGFCLTFRAFDEFIDGNGLRARLDYCNELLVEGAPRLGVLLGEAASLGKAISVGKMPADLAELVSEHARRLDEDLRALVVRSSALAEDGAETSFAGQQRTIININGLQGLQEAIKQCWASLFAERSLRYRVESAVTEPLSTGLVVQKLVDCEISGILFTASPDSLEPYENRKLFIDAVPGLGEAVVSGEVTPDHFVLEIPSLKVIERRPAAKLKRLEPAAGGGAHYVDIDEETADQPCMSDRRLREIAYIGLGLEKAFRAPQDIEWGYADGRFHILQARPITTGGASDKARKRPVLWSKALGEEFWSGAITPLMFDTVGTTIERTMISEPLEMIEDPAVRGLEFLGVHYGQVYTNCDALAAVIKKFPSWAMTEDLMFMFPEDEKERMRKSANWWFSYELITLFRNLVFSDYKWTPWNNYKVFEQYVRDEIPRIMRAQPRPGAAPAELLDEMDDLLAELGRYLKIVTWGVTYSYIFVPVTRTLAEFILRPVRGSDSVSRLFSRLPGNRTADTNRRILDMGAALRKVPGGLDIVEKNLADIGALEAELARLPGGADWFGKFRRFIDEFGHRAGDRDIYYYRWRDNPAPALEIILLGARAGGRGAGAFDDDQGDESTMAALKQRRSRLPGGRALLWALLAFSRKYLALRESMRFYADVFTAGLRRYALALGDQLARDGLISDRDEVFFYTRDELRRLPDAAADRASLRARARLRRKEFNESLQLRAPEFLLGHKGLPGAEFIGVRDESGRLEGKSSSSGVYSGRARVIRSQSEFFKLQKGEILVARSTDPAWTPLFAVAGALVLEIGGYLSHGSIVAREYGLPAVVGVHEATERIETGDEITVDGDNGLVYLSEESSKQELA